MSFEVLSVGLRRNLRLLSGSWRKLDRYCFRKWTVIYVSVLRLMVLLIGGACYFDEQFVRICVVWCGVVWCVLSGVVLGLKCPDLLVRGWCSVKI